MMTEGKVVVLSSGGVDSTAVLARAVGLYGRDNVTALTIFYGQRHEKEIMSARNVAAHFNVQHIELDLSSTFQFDNNPLLKKSDKEIPQGSYAEQNRENNGMSLTYVPFRNGLFLANAAAIAYSVGAHTIMYGAHADDAAGNAYPDCTDSFYYHMDGAIQEGTSGRVSLEAPLISLNKAGVVELGQQYDAPWHLTWSCYEGREAACGKCGTCIDRQEAFKQNGMMDPIPYEVSK